MKESKSRLKELLALFANQPQLLILVHPDPDSMASAMALRRMALRKCSRVVIAYDEPVKRLQNRAMVRLLKLKMVGSNELKPEDFDLVAIVDGQQDHFPALAGKRVEICIDHHPKAGQGDYRFSDIRPEVGATSSILYDYLDAGGAKISRHLATALCYGIKTDTDNFTRNVHKLDAAAFSRLFPMADYYLLRSIDLVEISIKDIDLFRAALERMTIKRQKAIIHLGQVPSTDLLVIIADFLIRVSEIETVLVSGFFAGRLTVIFRNRNPRKNIGLLAKKALEPPGTAGGHRYAARAEIPERCLPKNLRAREAGDQSEEIIKWLEKRVAGAKFKSWPRRAKSPSPCAP